MNEYEKKRYGWLNEFEENHHLFEWRISGTPVWEYIRDEMWFIIRQNWMRESTKSPEVYLQNNNHSSLFNLYKYGGYKEFRASDVLFANHPRRIWKNNERISPYLDKLVDGIEYSWQVMEPTDMGGSWGDVNTKNIVFIDPQRMACSLRANNGINTKVDSFLNLIEREFGFVFNEQDKVRIIELVTSVVQNRKRFMVYFYHLLKRIKPKVVVVLIQDYQPYRYLVAAANALSIPTVEYEHYYGNGAHIMDYYPTINCELETVCKYRWVSGELPIAHGDYKHLPICKSHIVPIGNSYVEYRINEVAMKSAEKSKIRNILVVSDCSVYTGLYSLAIELAERLRDEYRILFKLHPDEESIWREKYPGLAFSKVSVVGEMRNGDIFDYLSKSYCVVGTMSTALNEAVQMDKKVFVFSGAGNSHVEQLLVDCGCAEWISSADEVVEKLPSVEGYTPKRHPYVDDAVRRANKSLKRIIEEQKRR